MVEKQVKECLYARWQLFLFIFHLFLPFLKPLKNYHSSSLFSLSLIPSLPLLPLSGYWLRLNAIVIISIWNSMSAESLTLDEFPHFKAQWIASSNPNLYQHLYSPDQCQLKTLYSVSMRDLDCYSSRQAYCFPFCPRIYKYNIQRNQMTDNQITFDIKLILEHVPYRFDHPDYQQQIMGRIGEVVRTVQYLKRRYGGFRVRRGMVGLTELGLVKVWINEDFSSNQVQEITSSQKDMVCDLFELFEEHRFLEIYQIEDFQSLKHLVDHIEESSKKQMTLSNNKQALKSLQNCSSSYLLHDRSTNPKLYKQTDAQSTKSRKNITFSYSNKTLKQSQFVQRSNKKKSSIVLMQDDLQGLAKVLSMKKEFTFGVNGQELSSLKVVEPVGRHQRKMSCFRPSAQAENMSQQSSGEINIKKLTDHFSRASNSSSLNNVPTIHEVRQKFNTRPQLLHYSTSSNPYSKFVNKKASKQKSMSIFDQSEKSCNQRKDKENKRKTVGFQTTLCEFSVNEKEDNTMKTSQEIKNDLDALFTQNNDFDYKQLQSDLDNIL